MASTHNEGRGFGRIQTLLDFAVAIAVIAASGAVVWNVAASRQAPPPSTGNQQRPDAAARRPDLPVPAEPVSIAKLPTEGDPRAPIAIIEYSDFQCPFCGKFARETLPRLRQQFVQSGKAILVFRHMPLSIHQMAAQAAEGAECAARQGKFWEMHDRLFNDQQHLTDGDIRSAARDLGLETKSFDSCLAGGAMARVNQDAASAKLLGISGTPTFLLGTRQADGRVKVQRILSGNRPFEEFENVVKSIATAPQQARR
jgi:protein-disulfide isomerase